MGGVNNGLDTPLLMIWPVGKEHRKYMTIPGQCCVALFFAINMEVSGNGATPIAEWFLSWKNQNLKWMKTGGTPMTKRKPPCERWVIRETPVKICGSRWSPEKPNEATERTVRTTRSSAWQVWTLWRHHSLGWFEVNVAWTSIVRTSTYRRAPLNLLCGITDQGD